MTDEKCTLQGGKRFVVAHGVRVEPVVSASAHSQLPPRPSSRRKCSASASAGGRPPSSEPAPPAGSASGRDSAQLARASSSSNAVSWSGQGADEDSGGQTQQQARQRPVSARPRLQQAPVCFAAPPPKAGRQDDAQGVDHGAQHAAPARHMLPPPPSPPRAPALPAPPAAEAHEVWGEMAHHSLRRGQAGPDMVISRGGSAAGAWVRKRTRTARSIPKPSAPINI